MTKKILLVEDDPSDARLIQRAFLKAGIKEDVYRLTNGDDAVAYMNGEGPYSNRALYPMPSLVLLDIKLPRRSGIEVLRYIRGCNHSIRRVPIVMLTSSRHSVDVNRAYDYGANSYLTKPDTMQQLVEMAVALRSYWLTLNEEPTLGDS
jgi:DNA-binding response OmpR family regulator